MSPSTHPQAPLEQLIRHNRQVLEQALAVTRAYRALPPACFADHTGPHLRHVIEHFEALLSPAEPGVIDYDHRPRDRALETCPDLAIARLQALIEGLARLDERDAPDAPDAPDAADRRSSTCLDEPLVVRAQVGVRGPWSCSVGSTLGRELVVLASHAVHHYALLRSHCQRHGISVCAEFGIAPSTLAHALATDGLAANPAPRSQAPQPSNPTPSTAHLESPCPVC